MRSKKGPEAYSWPLLTATVLQPGLAKRILKGAGSPILHVGEYVRVGVQGDGYSSVPQDLRNDLGVYISRQEQRGAGVAEVVKSDAREPSLVQEWHEEPLSEIRRIHERASLG